jgi:hypothetical protein
MKTRVRGLMTAAALGVTLALTMAGPAGAGVGRPGGQKVLRFAVMNPMAKLARLVWTGMRAAWGNSSAVLIGGGVAGDE